MTSAEICWMVSVEFETVNKSVMDESVRTIGSLSWTRPWLTGRVGLGWFDAPHLCEEVVEDWCQSLWA